MRLAPAILASLLAIPASLPALDPPGAALRLERSSGGLPVVSAGLGGETLRFVLDTGTSRSMIAASAAGRLGLAPRARFAVVTAAGPARAAACAGPLEVRVGGLSLTVACLGWVPDETSPAGLEDVDGVLGADALAGVDLWLDLRRSQARLAPAGQLGPWCDGERLPLATIEERPALAVELSALPTDARRAVLVLDSGTDRPLLFGEAARNAGRALGMRGLPGRLRTAAGGSDLALVPLGELRVGRTRRISGWSGLLPEVADRGEDGLLPIGLLGPVLLDLADAVVVIGARLRTAPAAIPPLRRSAGTLAAVAAGATPP